MFDTSKRRLTLLLIFLLRRETIQFIFAVPLCRSVAGSSSLDQTLPLEENNANRLVEQIQELIDFLANR